ncbi:hypothetical protein BKA63DRAFT_535114 [Paraphoma chrysanthemicola]|nr:hypothetical protein BKA63DRAFT_535114 [Paraphoma chrysanthemicola]
MRLINTRTLALEEFIGREIPKYAILSHTWEGQEVTYDDYVDTCCIDKRSSAELTESINSMYLWYQRSTICYAYLSDLPADADVEESQIYQQMRMFTRGWTLQELLAPSRMLFFDAAWINRGSKQSLAKISSAITRIDIPLLCGKTTLSGYSVAQRMSWAAPRQTTRVEDTAYCLFGIFALNLPLLYGEGRKAFRRLQAEILRTIPDLNTEYRHIFNPESHDLVLSGVLATSPAEFYSCLNLVSHAEDTIPDVSISNFGIKLPTESIGLSRLSLGACKENLAHSSLACTAYFSA